MKLRRVATLLALVSSLVSGQALACSATTPCINELLLETPGNDELTEYIELRFTSGATFDPGTYLVAVEGDFQNNRDQGSIDSVIDLSGLQFGDNGFLVLLTDDSSYSVNTSSAQLASVAPGFSGLPPARWSADDGNTTYERPSTSFFLIHSPNVAPLLTDDIDEDDDGEIDPTSVVQNWTIFDSVGTADNPNKDRSYAAINFRTSDDGQPDTVLIATKPIYLARFGDSFGSAANAWVASGTVTGSNPNWSLSTSVTYPQGLVGKPLNHIGSTNAWFNIAPVNTLPATATIDEDEVLPFPGTFFVTDTDAGSSQVQVTISTVNGTFTLSQTTGLVFTAGDGTADTTMTFQGTVRNVDNTQGGTINAALLNSFFTPNPQHNGTGSLTINTNDLGNTGTTGPLSDIDTLNITINSLNDPPTFTLGTVPAILEDAGAQSVANVVTALAPGGGADEANQNVAVSSVTVTTGSLVFATAPAIDATGTLTYEAAADSNGTATVEVTVSDDGSNVPPSDNSTAQSFTISVGGVNDEPGFALAAGPATVDEDAGAQTVAGFAISFDAGPADEDASQIVQSYNLTQTGTTGTLAFSAGPSVAADGTLTYTPAANSNGTATYTISVTDNGGTANGGDDTSGDQTFTITVNAIEDAPTLSFAVGTATGDEDASASLAGFATIANGGADEANQTLTFAFTPTGTPDVAFATAPAIAPNGTLTFVPATDDNGSASFDVTLSDGNTTTAAQALTITIAPVNDAPIVSIPLDEVVVAEEVGAVTQTGFATFAPGPATATDEAGQANAGYALTSIAVTNGLTFTAPPAIDATGTLTFTVAPNFSGTASFSAVVTDNGSGTPPNVNTSAPVTFDIIVNGTNDEPSFTGGLDQVVDEDAGPQTLSGWASAIEDGDSGETQILTFDVAVTGTLTFSAGPAVDPGTGNLTYTTAPNANGIANVTVTLRDNGGTVGSGDDTSASFPFTITANPLNDTPAFTLGGNLTIANTAGPQSLSGHASGITNGGPDEAGQVLSFNVSVDVSGLFSTQPSINPTGGLGFAPLLGALGSVTVTVSLSDDAGATSAEQSFTIDLVEPSSLVDPTVVSINRAGTNPATSSPVTYTVTFSETVNGVDSADFAVVAGGTLTGASISIVSCANATCTVTIGITDGAGTLGLNLVDNDSILDVDTNPLGGTGAVNGDFTGQIYNVDLTGGTDTTPPTVTTVVRANPSPSPGPTVAFIVTFSESVTAVDAADFQLTLGGALVGPSIANVSGSGAVYTIVVNTGTGTGTIRLDVVDDDSILDVAALPLGGANPGNGAFTTGEVYEIDTINGIPIFRDGFEDPPTP